MISAIAPKVQVLDMTHFPQLNSSSPRQHMSPHKQQQHVPSDDSTCSTALSSSDESENHFHVRKQQATRNNNTRRQKRKTGKQLKRGYQQLQQLTPEEAEQYVALDCEMCGVGPRGRHSSVARVTVIDWNGVLLLDEFVQQEAPVTDYRTFVSGITEDDLTKARLTYDECRVAVQSLLDGKVLVGHALKNDLKALNLTHPWYMTRDTAKYEPFMKVRFDDGVLWPRKLKELAQSRLKREIQQPAQPHSPYEDALAALDLYHMVRNRWEKAVEYKMKKTKEYESRQAAALKQQQ